MAILSVLCGLFGCVKTPDYTLDDIQSVSVTCGHMDYSYSYSFYLRRTENDWLLDADYATDTEQPRTVFEAVSVSDEDAKALLSVLAEQDVFDKLRRYKKPKIKFQVADETTYYTSVQFADVEQLSAPIYAGDDFVTEFRRLAEKYANTAIKADDTE